MGAHVCAFYTISHDGTTRAIGLSGALDTDVLRLAATDACVSKDCQTDVLMRLSVL